MMVNPNEAVQQDFQIHLPENPILANVETCLTGGPIGWTIHGVALYNPFNAFGTNAVEGDEAETFDECQGHPDGFGSYHYHQLPDECVFPGRNLQVHGIARDGFPIYGPYKENGDLVTESELDKCHGRCGDDGNYRYHMTKNYPYILGCFRGTPMDYTRAGSAQQPPGGDDTRPPPQDGQQQPPDGTRPPPPDGQQPPDGQRPAPDGQGQGGDMGSPNQCAYNPDAMAFEQCSASSNSEQEGNEPEGNGTGPCEATFTLTLTAILLTWFHRHI